MDENVESMVDEIEINLFTHGGKFPRGFDFIVNVDLNDREVISAVYVLLNSNELLYVGQSKDVTRRIRTHKRKGIIPFTTCAYLPIRPDLRTEMEASLIWNFKPKYNKDYPPLSETAKLALAKGKK